MLSIDTDYKGEKLLILKVNLLGLSTGEYKLVLVPLLDCFFSILFTLNFDNPDQDKKKKSYTIQNLTFLSAALCFG